MIAFTTGSETVVCRRNCQQLSRPLHLRFEAYMGSGEASTAPPWSRPRSTPTEILTSITGVHANNLLSSGIDSHVAVHRLHLNNNDENIQLLTVLIPVSTEGNATSFIVSITQTMENTFTFAPSAMPSTRFPTSFILPPWFQKMFHRVLLPLMPASICTLRHDGYPNSIVTGITSHPVTFPGPTCLRPVVPLSSMAVNLFFKAVV